MVKEKSGKTANIGQQAKVFALTKVSTRDLVRLIDGFDHNYLNFCHIC